MGYLKYLKEAWKKPGKVVKERLLSWRRGPSFERLDKPTRPDRARAAGYKAKQGFVVVRARIRRGGRNRPKVPRGRKPSKAGRVKYYPKKSMQLIAEERVARRFSNMEVLNSYWAGEDGVHTWFEVILIDPSHEAVRKDPDVNWVAMKPSKRRVFHGKTSAGKKARGLTKKGHHRSRPSVKAKGSKGK
jgi:large subunit ribosomal protein L15e